MERIKTQDGSVNISQDGTEITLLLKDEDGWFKEDTNLSVESTIQLIHALIRALNAKYSKGTYIPPVHFGNVG